MKNKNKILKKLEKARTEHLKIHSKDMTTEQIDAYIQWINQAEGEELEQVLADAKKFLEVL